MQEILIKGLLDNNQEVIIHLSKLLALIVRDEIEQFHVDHLSDAQMKELNPLIRNGIYNALFILANCNNDTLCSKLLSDYSNRIPSYWEDPELNKHLQKVLDKIPRRGTIKFQSQFLNEQLKLGNLIYNKVKNCIEIKPSYEFIDVAGDKHRHRDKLSSSLRKEGYRYRDSLYGYVDTKL